MFTLPVCGRYEFSALLLVPAEFQDKFERFLWELFEK